MSFRRLALHLIRKKHLGIDLSGINFTSMKGHNISNPNDGSTVEPEKVVGDGDDDVEVEGSSTLEGVEDASGTNPMVVEPTMEVPILALICTLKG